MGTRSGRIVAVALVLLAGTGCGAKAGGGTSAATPGPTGSASQNPAPAPSSPEVSASQPAASPTATAPSAFLAVPHAGGFSVDLHDGVRYGVVLRTGSLQRARPGLAVGVPGDTAVGTRARYVLLGSACTDIDYAKDAVLPLSVTLTGPLKRGMEVRIVADGGPEKKLPASARIELEDDGTGKATCSRTGAPGTGGELESYDPPAPNPLSYPAGSKVPTQGPPMDAFLILKDYRGHPKPFGDVNLTIKPVFDLKAKDLPTLSRFSGMQPDRYINILDEPVTDGGRYRLVP